MDFRKSLVLITGASSGIGAATAKEFAKYNATVLLLARREEELKKISDDIKQNGGYAKYYLVDISDYKSVEKACNKIRKEVGIPDIIFNNGGIGIWKFVEETSPEEVHKLMTVYFGAFFVTRCFMAEMLKRNSGHIVNMSSASSVLPFPGLTGYISAHAAMRGFNEALRMDLYDTNIKVTLVSLAKIKSTFWTNNPGSEERYTKIAYIMGVPTVDYVAKKIVKGVYKGKNNIVIPFLLRPTRFLSLVLPGFMRWILWSTGYKRKLDNSKK